MTHISPVHSGMAYTSPWHVQISWSFCIRQTHHLQFCFSLDTSLRCLNMLFNNLEVLFYRITSFESLYHCGPAKCWHCSGSLPSCYSALAEGHMLLLAILIIRLLLLGDTVDVFHDPQDHLLLVWQRDALDSNWQANCAFWILDNTAPMDTDIYVMSSLSYRPVLNSPASSCMSCLHWATDQFWTPQHQLICHSSLS